MGTGYHEIIDYWFSDKNKKYWFSSTTNIDKEIKTIFEDVWSKASKGGLSEWQNSPEGALALIIVLDQLPLNMFRGESKSFQTESMALEIAITAINNGYDKKLIKDKLKFLFMPLMHSENIENQNLGVKLFKRYGFDLQWPKHHRDLINRFGRFPHRNEILGRQSTTDEIEYLLSNRVFKG
jgi:uncharacterized protein (DUF924 family)